MPRPPYSAVPALDGHVCERNGRDRVNASARIPFGGERGWRARITARGMFPPRRETESLFRKNLPSRWDAVVPRGVVPIQ
jgi:hypothetical protein